MKKLKFKLVIAILAFLIGIVGVWGSKIIFVISDTPQKLSTLIDLPPADAPYVEPTLDEVDVFSEQTPTIKKDLGVFNPSGDYHPINRPPDDKFIQFDLKVKRRKGKLVAWGEIRGVQPWYKFASVSVTEKHLKFSTVRIDGVSYDFDGKFIGEGDFASQSFGHGILMLKGTLRKFVNGKKVMEISTSFSYFAGC